MKIKQDVNLSILTQYGFDKIDKEQANKDEEYTLSIFDYVHTIGYARRGQFYYLLVSELTRELHVFASKPDGDGCSINIDDIIIRLYKDNLIEEQT